MIRPVASMNDITRLEKWNIMCKSLIYMRRRGQARGELGLADVRALVGKVWMWWELSFGIVKGFVSVINRKIVG